jgi:hypothetical protein
MPESVDPGRRRFIGAAAAAALGAGLISSAAQEMACAAVGLSYEGAIPSLGGATGWLNSPPLTPTASLRGKVALVDFWTYTCVNPPTPGGSGSSTPPIASRPSGPKSWMSPRIDRPTGTTFFGLRTVAETVAGTRSIQPVCGLGTGSIGRVPNHTDHPEYRAHSP